MSKVAARTLLHAAAAAVMSWGFSQLRYAPGDAWIRTQKGGHWQFLTIQGLACAWLTMLISLASDLAPSVLTFRRLKRTLLMLAMPLSFVVSSIYWSLLIFMPHMMLRPVEATGGFVQPDELVPSSSDAAPQLMRIPLPLDLALHAAPAISMFLDFTLFEKRYSKKQAFFGGIPLCTVAAIGYATWVEYCASFNGSFPYPFLTENPPEIRKAIYAGAGSLALVTFWIVNALHP